VALWRGISCGTGGAPAFVHGQSGAEFIPELVQKWISDRDFKTLDIAPGNLQKNPYTDIFNRRIQDEFLNRESSVKALG